MKLCARYARITVGSGRALTAYRGEEKPLAYFHPGSMILSVGSFGCSLSYPFCQNHEIAKARETAWIAEISPEIPLHITRYFPRYKMREPATDISLLRELKEIAEGSCAVFTWAMCRESSSRRADFVL